MLTLDGFNPTMVRLLPDNSGSFVYPRISFNLTMVRLLQVIDGYTWTVVAVSIPQWCDCCFTRLSTLLLRF